MIGLIVEIGLGALSAVTGIARTIGKLFRRRKREGTAESSHPVRAEAHIDVEMDSPGNHMRVHL